MNETSALQKPQQISARKAAVAVTTIQILIRASAAATSVQTALKVFRQQIIKVATTKNWRKRLQEAITAAALSPPTYINNDYEGNERTNSVVATDEGQYSTPTTSNQRTSMKH